MIAAQLTSPQTVQAALERAMQQRPATDRAEVNGGSWFRLGDGAQAAVRNDVLFLALGGTPPGEEQPARGKSRKKQKPKKLTLADLGILGKVLVLQGPSLGQHFKKIGVVGFDVPGQQNVWIDVAGIVRSVERAAGAQGGMAGQGARLFAERAADLRDALYEMRPGKEGLDADLWLRFLPPKKSAAK